MFSSFQSSGQGEFLEMALPGETLYESLVKCSNASSFKFTYDERIRFGRGRRV